MDKMASQGSSSSSEQQEKPVCVRHRAASTRPRQELATALWVRFVCVHVCLVACLGEWDKKIPLADP